MSIFLTGHLILVLVAPEPKETPGGFLKNPDARFMEASAA
jgi:hypothetical protein